MEKINGIDLRCKKKDELIVVQVKHYKEINLLLSKLKNEELEKELLKQYEKYMQTYKHTFKKNDNGEYYWYSTEPIISETEEKQIEEIAKNL